MNSEYTLISHPSINPELEKLLADGINTQAYLLRKMPPIQEFSVELRNLDRHIIGGATGASVFGNLYVDMLWVAPHVRAQGWGTQVMRQAETIGKERGCCFATVNTMDWQALPFYQKLGYTIEFTREGFEKEAKMFFLRKILD